METIIKKWGNSLGIRIPNFIVKELSLKEGSSVQIEDEGDKIIITPKRKQYLSEMLKDITDENLHNEIETDSIMGNEIW